MGQPGHYDVSSDVYSPSESFIDCDKCHDAIPRYNSQDQKPKSKTCKFFGSKDKVGLIGANGCESYRSK